MFPLTIVHPRVKEIVEATKELVQATIEKTDEVECQTTLHHW